MRFDCDIFGWKVKFYATPKLKQQRLGCSLVAAPARFSLSLFDACMITALHILQCVCIERIRAACCLFCRHCVCMHECIVCVSVCIAMRCLCKPCLYVFVLRIAREHTARRKSIDIYDWITCRVDVCVREHLYVFVYACLWLCVFLPVYALNVFCCLLSCAIRKNIHLSTEPNQEALVVQS